MQTVPTDFPTFLDDLSARRQGVSTPSNALLAQDYTVYCYRSGEKKGS